MPNKNKSLSLADVLASEIPNTKDKAAERWLYLKSEYQHSAGKKDLRDALNSVAVIVLSAIGFACIIVSLCLEHT